MKRAFILIINLAVFSLACSHKSKPEQSKIIIKKVYKQGLLYKEFPTLNRKKHGIEITYYGGGSGRILSKISFRNGVKHGVCIYFNLYQNVSEKVNYVNGKKHGAETFYNMSGNLIKTVYYKHGVVIKK